LPKTTEGGGATITTNKEGEKREKTAVAPERPCALKNKSTPKYILAQPGDRMLKKHVHRFSAKKKGKGHAPKAWQRDLNALHGN